MRSGPSCRGTWITSRWAASSPRIRRRTARGRDVKVLGIAGRRRHAAAALAIDGAIVSAATEECCTRLPNVGYAAEGGLPAAAIDACLSRAGIDASAVDEIAIVDDGSDSGAGPVPDPAEMQPFRRAATRL